MSEVLKGKLAECVEEFNENVDKLTNLHKGVEELQNQQMKLLGKIELLQEQINEDSPEEPVTDEQIS